jgi:hypothetical protein
MHATVDIPENVARIAMYQVPSPDGEFPHVPMCVQKVEVSGVMYEVFFRAVRTKDKRAWRWELVNRVVEG